MLQINKDLPVMVTGTTGYVAGWIVKRLLEEGLTVHAAVRDPDNADLKNTPDGVFTEEIWNTSPAPIRKPWQRKKPGKSPRRRTAGTWLP